MPEMTILVPLLHDIEEFEATLASVLRFSHQDVQIIGLHDGQYEDQYGIGEEIELIAVDSKSRANLKSGIFGQLALALDDVRSPWIHWIAPGIEPLGDCYDQVFQQIAENRELGSISPQVLPKIGAEDIEIDDLECLASSVTATAGFHPQYLEEVVGECWTLSDLRSDINLAGPTEWAGFCRKSLFQGWVRDHSNHLRFGEGYRDLALGLYLKSEGWEHQIIQCSMVASEKAELQIGQSWKRNGSNVVQIMADFGSGSGLSKVMKNLFQSSGEILQSVIAPGNLLPAFTRLLSTSQLLQAKPKRRFRFDESEDDCSVPFENGTASTYQKDSGRRAA